MNITETNYIHVSGTDELPLRVLRIEPENAADVRGIVQIVHGKNEHKGRYAEFMRYLAMHGYIAVANDHRGHGESVLCDDDRGYMYSGGADALVDDVHEITLEIKEYAKRKCGRDDLPVTLLGHSMGSLAVRCYIRKYDGDIDKLCILGSPSKSVISGAGVLLLKILGAVSGERSRSRLADFLIMELPYGFRYKKEGLRNAWTNTDREDVIAHNNDPLCRYRFTIGAYKAMLKMGWLAYKDDYIPDNPDMPIKFFSGKDDPCYVSEKKMTGSIMLLKKIGYSDVRGQLYDNMRHDILHEREKERVFRNILRFIGK